MNIVTQNEGRCRPPVMPFGLTEASDTPRAGPVFDQWLTHHLGRLYDPVVNEPIPAELLRLLEIRLK
jgi:hypothetical protein